MLQDIGLHWWLKLPAPTLNLCLPGLTGLLHFMCVLDVSEVWLLRRLGQIRQLVVLRLLVVLEWCRVSVLKHMYRLRKRMCPY